MSQTRRPSGPDPAGFGRAGLHSPSHEFGLYRKLHERGVPIPARITATDLRRDLREVLARVEYGLPHTTSLVDTALATLALGRAHAALAAAPSPRSSWGEGRPRCPRRPSPRRRRRQAA